MTLAFCRNWLAVLINSGTATSACTRPSSYSPKAAQITRCAFGFWLFCCVIAVLLLGQVCGSGGRSTIINAERSLDLKVLRLLTVIDAKLL